MAYCACALDYFHGLERKMSSYWSMWRVLVLLLIGVSCPIYCAALVSYKNTIVVDPEHGVNNASCLPSARAAVDSDSHQFGASSQIPCRNLSYALQSFRLSSTQYVLKSGPTHTLGSGIEPLENIDDVALVASNGTALIRCLPRAGLSFINCSGVVLNNLTFTGCGALRNSTSRNYSQADSGMQTFLVTLYFYQCQNISMDCVNVSNSVYATGVVMYDTYGTNMITGSTFTNNSVDDQHSGGGGFYIEFSYCVPGDTECGDESHRQVIGTSNSSYRFSNCTFSENKANTISQSSSGYILPYHENHESFGRGGGLSIYFKGSATNNNISVSECHFIHNHALWGGGLLVEFDDESIANWVSVVSSHFLCNHCYFKEEFGTGGGARIASMEQHRVSPSKTRGNLVNITGCAFIDNQAINGGALSLAPLLQPKLSKDQVTAVHIYNCSFAYNTGRLGSAVNVATLSLIIHGEVMHVQFTGCTFFSNNAEYSRVLENSSWHSVGAGAVYVNGVPVSFEGSTKFIRNNASALVVVGAYLDFSNCTTLFLANTGRKGAGIALLGNSFLVIDDYTVMNFMFNNAYLFGGAIYNDYIGMEDLKVYINCFIKYTDPNKGPKHWNSSFSFFNNSALLGNAIYSTSIQPCSWSAGSGIGDNSSEIFCWNENWDYNNRSCKDEIYTEPQKFFHSKSISVFPGIGFNMSIDARDDLDHNLSDTFYIAHISNGLGKVEEQYAVVAHDVLAVTGTGNLSLSLTTTGSRIWDLNLTLIIDECPPGLTLKNGGRRNATCGCALNYPFRGNLKCEFNSSTRHYSTYLTERHWIGTIGNSSKVVVGECPEGYCYHSNLSLPNSTDLLDEYICKNQSRTGVLCGECIDGYGPAVNSWEFECVPCNSTDTTKHIIFYILIAYVPTFLIFVAIILLNIRLTTGPAVSFILYAQMISSVFNSRNYGFENISVSLKMQNAYHFIYSIFNLDFFSHLGFPFCLSPHLNVLDILQLQYLQACFPLLMIVLVIVYVKLKDCFWGRCKRLFNIRRQGNDRRVRPNRQKLGTSLVHAFAAFLLLSYTKFGIPSSLILHTVDLYREDGTPVTVQRVYLAGNYSISDKSYSGYSLLSSIVIVVFILIPPLLLLDKPVRWFNHYIAARVRCLRYVWPVDKVNIILDVFNGCYKPHMGFFAGLYFLFRLALFVTDGVSGGFLQYSLQQIFCCAIIAMLVIFQPYRNHLYNIVDALIFFDMAAINSLSNYAATEAVINPRPTHPTAVFVIRSILIYLPLVYILSYLIWYFVTTYRAQVKLLLVRAFRRNNDYQPLQGPTSKTSTSYNSIIDSDSVLLQRAQEPNTYRPSEHTHRAESDEEEQTAQTMQGATPSTDQNSQSQMEVHDRILSSVIEN